MFAPPTKPDCWLYRLYYQHNPARLAACPLTIHALLHIADGIDAVGPVWVSWNYPTERCCGQIQRSIKSRRFPYASINESLHNQAQLAYAQMIFELEKELGLRTTNETPGFQHPSCTCSDVT